MDTVTFDFLRPETTGPHAADKFIVISQHMLPLSTLVCGHGGTGPPDSWGLERKHRYAAFGRHFIGLAVIGLDEQEGTIEGPAVHASDGVRLLPLRYPVASRTRAVWDRARQVCRDAVEVANPQTAHPLGGARMAADPAHGVVDPDGFVHGVEGLSVLDGAFVPSAIGVNPSLTIAALVERAMARRVEALGRPDAAVLRPSDVLASGPPAAPPSAPPTLLPSTPPGTAPTAIPATGHGARALPAALAAGAAATLHRLARSARPPDEGAAP
jgi:choline dehydrogenase-like flavoprotein